MKKVSRVFLFGALVLVVLTAACGAEESTTPPVLATLPGAEATSTLPGGVDATQTVGTETATTAATAETPTAALETPTLSGTDSVSTPVTSVGSTATRVGQTQGIPVTGLDIVLVECQFCIDTLAHALLVLPDTATFEVTAPTASAATTDTVKTICSTIEVNNGKQVVLCSGPEKTPITLNICTDANTCTDFPVDLQPCPLTQSGTAVPNTTQEAHGTLSKPSATATP